jgi:hypothetical protein
VFTQKSEKDPHVIPSDAKVVILASPYRPYPKEVLDALDKFVESNGKLIVLARPNIVVEQADTLAVRDLKLAEFLEKYSVQLGKGYLLKYVQRVDEGPPYIVRAYPPTESRNEIARGFRNKRFDMIIPRKVEPIEGKGTYHVEKLLEVHERPHGKVWEETNPAALHNLRDYLDGLAFSGQLDAKASPVPICVAVAVSDREQRPRMVVIGDSAFADNQFIRREPHFYDFLTSSIEWLVERPGNIGISPRESKSFMLRADDVQPGRMKYVPLGLMLLTFLGLGTGIWIIRRR